MVTDVGRQWPGAVELDVLIEQDPSGTVPVRALAYVELVGRPQVGDTVVLNVGALVRGLGTGGYALVLTIPDRLPADREAGPGHLVKARYTPMQTMVLGVDEQESEHHSLLADADDLGGLPVVVADLHSAVPAIVAGARWSAQRSGRRAPRVGYVMTDGGALPAWFSRTVAGLTEAGWLTSTVTVGQAFGGSLEAVTVHTGLLAARLVAGCDLVVVAQGPGNLGTGTRWGFSGVAAGEAINAAATLKGRPVASLRVSQADPRDRHRGVSHHSLTAYGRVALSPADLVVPTGDDPERRTALAQVATQAQTLCPPHRRVEVDTPIELRDALAASPVPMRSMGRSLDDDPEAFLAAAAAGVHGERLRAGEAINGQ